MKKSRSWPKSFRSRKAAYLQYRNTGDRPLTKRRDPKNAGFTADTPAPYRIEDLITLIDERMGKLENRSSRMHHYKLLQRHPDLPQ